MSFAFRDRLATLFVGLGILVVVVVMSVAAYLSYPVYDDAYVALMIGADRADEVSSMPDRPLLGRWFQAAVDTGRFPLAGAMSNAIALLLTALVTGRLWAVLYPAYRRYWPAAGLLATAPILSEIAATVAIVFQLQTVSVYLIALWIWPRPGRPTSRLRIAVAVVLLGCLGSVSEYSISACATTAVLLFLVPHDPSIGRTAKWEAAIGILAGAVLGYALFRLFADAGYRQGVNPGDSLEFLRTRSWTIPLKLAENLLAAAGAAVFREFNHLTFRTRIGLAAAVVGILIAAGNSLYFASRKQGEAASAVRPDAATAPAIWLRLMVSIAAGLLPFLIMAMVLNDEFADSRFYLGVLPASACAMLGLPMILVRQRYHTALACAAIWVSVYVALNDAGTWYRSHQTLVRTGDEIRPLLKGDFTLVLVDLREADYRSLTRQMHDIEVTMSMTQNWSDADRRRVWFIPVNYAESPPAAASATDKPWGAVTPPGPASGWKFRRDVRAFSLETPVDRVLLLTYVSPEQLRVTDLTTARPVLVK